MPVEQTQLPQDEREDFEGLVRQYGKDPAEFLVEVMENVPVEPGIIYRNVDLTVGDVKVSYEGGHGRNWLGDFERDLQRGLFP